MRPENKKESVTDNENVVVLGTGGLVGGAIARKLPHATWVRGREDCDLTKAYAVDDLMVDLQPDVVIHAAGMSVVSGRTLTTSQGICTTTI